MRQRGHGHLLGSTADKILCATKWSHPARTSCHDARFNSDRARTSWSRRARKALNNAAADQFALYVALYLKNQSCRSVSSCLPDWNTLVSAGLEYAGVRSPIWAPLLLFHFVLASSATSRRSAPPSRQGPLSVSIRRVSAQIRRRSDQQDVILHGTCEGKVEPTQQKSAAKTLQTGAPPTKRGPVFNVHRMQGCGFPALLQIQSGGERFYGYAPNWL